MRNKIMSLVATMGLVGSLSAQSGDPGGQAIWTFVEHNNVAPCGPTKHGIPMFDPAQYPGCMMPPNQCPYPAMSYVGQAAVQWVNIEPGNPCFLFIQAGNYLNHWVGCDFVFPDLVLSIIPNVSGNADLGTAKFIWNLPVQMPPTFPHGGWTVGYGQVVQLGTNSYYPVFGSYVFSIQYSW